MNLPLLQPKGKKTENKPLTNPANILTLPLTFIWKKVATQITDLRPIFCFQVDQLLLRLDRCRRHGEVAALFHVKGQHGRLNATKILAKQNHLLHTEAVHCNFLNDEDTEEKCPSTSSVLICLQISFFRFFGCRSSKPCKPTTSVLPSHYEC